MAKNLSARRIFSLLFLLHNRLIYPADNYSLPLHYYLVVFLSCIATLKNSRAQKQNRNKPSQQREQRETHVDATTVEVNLISHETIRNKKLFFLHRAPHGMEKRKKEQKSIRESQGNVSRRLCAKEIEISGVKRHENLFNVRQLAGLSRAYLTRCSCSSPLSQNCFTIACLIIKTTTRIKVVIPVCPVLINSRRTGREIYVRLLMKRVWSAEESPKIKKKSE
jgi:hypothetical protein